MVTIIATNKQALFDYDIIEKFDAGLVLSGQEVKSVKGGHINLKGSYVTLIGGEVWLLNAHISLYKKASAVSDYDPYRSRKLLLNKREIEKLMGARATDGLTIVPISVYTNHSKIKVEIGIGRGRRKFEKREVLKKRAIDRDIRATLKTKSHNT